MSLSIQESRSGSRLVLFFFPFRRVAVGVGLAVGLLIPWLFEFTERPTARHTHRNMVTLAVAVMAVTACVTGAARYQIALPGGSVQWWSIRLWRARWGSTCIDTDSAASGLQPASNYGRPIITLDGRPTSVDLPLPRNPTRHLRVVDRLARFLAQPSVDGNSQTVPSIRPAQRSLLWLFCVMSIVAVVIAAARFFSQEVISLGIAVFVLAVFARTFWTPADQRSRVQAILLAMYLPFVWIIAYNKPFGFSSGMLQYLPISPSLVTSMLVTAGNPQWYMPAMALLLVPEIWLATAIARRGAAGAIATLVIVLALSSFSSIIIHALYRM